MGKAKLKRVKQLFEKKTLNPRKALCDRIAQWFFAKKAVKPIPIVYSYAPSEMISNDSGQVAAYYAYFVVDDKSCENAGQPHVHISLVKHEELNAWFYDGLRNAALIRNIAKTDSSLATEIANELLRLFNSDGCPRILEELSHYLQYLRAPTLMTMTRDENYVYENDPIEIEAKKMAGESYEDLKREMPDIAWSPLMVFARECSSAITRNFRSRSPDH